MMTMTEAMATTITEIKRRMSTIIRLEKISSSCFGGEPWVVNDSG
jgi:hypothetical protein